MKWITLAVPICLFSSEPAMTTQYSAQCLIEKLDKLAHSQESIQMTSFWIIFYRKYADKTAHIWAEEVIVFNLAW